MRLISIFGGEEPPKDSGRYEPEPVVLKPSCAQEAWLTVRGGLEWDRQHPAQDDGEQSKSSSWRW